MFIQTSLGHVRADQITRFRDVEKDGFWRVELTLNDGTTATVFNCDGGADELASKLGQTLPAVEGWHLARLYYHPAQAGDAHGQVRAELSVQPIIAWSIGNGAARPITPENWPLVWPYAVVSPDGLVVEDRLQLGEWINQTILDEAATRAAQLNEAAK
jgi:hypothetical protein